MKKLLASLALGLGLLIGGTAVIAQTPAPAASAPAAEAAASAPAAPAAAAPAAAAPAAPAEAAPAAPAPKVDSGDTAWMLTSTMLVILMTIPGLALFYGGLSRSKNMLSVLMQVFVIFSLISVLWALYGYSLAFAGDGNFIGGLDKIFLKGVGLETFGALTTIPEYVFVAFQGTFAAITVALIVGAFAERAKFSAVLLFSVLWFTFSYLPMAHIVWGGGLLAKDGALDFAGGTVVHINAGVAGLVGAYLVGKRIGYGKEAMTPHSLTLTMVGASLLWVGWFGFNAGSAGAANSAAGLAFVNTVLATAAATLSWIAGESLAKGKASMLGAASGAVAGLVAVTPAAGFVGPMGSIVLGLIAGLVCLWGVGGLKKMLGADDAFDVFGVHGVGGIVGAILTGVFAAKGLGGTGGLTPDRSFTHGRPGVDPGEERGLHHHLVRVVAFIAFKIADLVIGLRVTEEEEREGLDISSHGETAYNR
jgi:Amt family ammonium transporter